MRRSRQQKCSVLFWQKAKSKSFSSRKSPKPNPLLPETKKVTTKNPPLIKMSKSQLQRGKKKKKPQRSRYQGRGRRQKQEQGGSTTGKSARRNVLEWHHAWQRNNLANGWGRGSMGGSITWCGEQVWAVDATFDDCGVVVPSRGDRETSWVWVSNHDNHGDG